VDTKTLMANVQWTVMSIVSSSVLAHMTSANDSS
jgi:hypothetical protein